MQAIGRSLLAAIVLATGVFVPMAHAQGPVPDGGEFQINAYTPYPQKTPSIAGLEGGGFVVVWASDESGGSDSSGKSIQGQRFAADGTAEGAQFQVNSATANDQYLPAVAGLADGGFVVAWESYAPNPSDTIQGRRYDAGGTPAGEFQVNTEPTHLQAISPAAAGLAGGGFVVMWHSLGPHAYSLDGQRYAAGGTPVGEQFQIDPTTASSQFEPSVAALPDGGFVVAWHSYELGGPDTSEAGIRGQRFSADGTAAGAQFQVNSTFPGIQRAPSVATLADGAFVVVWHSSESGGSDSSFDSIQGQRYAADGAPAGGEFQINSYTFGQQLYPAVAGLPDGGFVAAWQSEGSSGSDTDNRTVQGRRFGADGSAIGGDFQVNTATGFDQDEAAIAALGNRDFVVAWASYDSNGTDSSGKSIQGQRYTAPRFALVGLAGKCLDVENADPRDGTPTVLFECHGGENQRWQMELTRAPQPIVGLGGHCLVPGFVDVSGDTRAVIGDCGGPESLWRLADPSHAEASVLVHEETGQCLDVAGGSGGTGADGTPVILFDCHGGDNQRWRPAAETCTRDSFGVCLASDRFRVDLEWRSFDGTSGSGRAVPVGSDHSGLLWFFEAENWEMLIKVLDGCAFNNRFWVFAAATTTVEYTLRVTDTELGTIREYFNPLGDAAAAITDTDAFAACPAGATAPASLGDAGTFAAASPAISNGPGIAGTLLEPKLQGFCDPSSTRLCLSQGRFSVEVEWQDYAGNTGTAQVVPAATEDSGLFWFFAPGNWEMLVKVLDACDFNDQFLFLGAATTDVQYTLTVTHLDSGVFWQHTNPLGNPSEALVQWFETCE